MLGVTSRFRARRSGIALLACMLVAAACSSTKADNRALDLRAAGSAEVTPADSTGAAGDAGSTVEGNTVTTGGSGVTAPSASGGAGRSGAASSGSGSSAPGGSSGGVTAAPEAPPASSEPILIGAYGLTAGGGAVGLSGAALGDPVAFSEAMADWINKHGGVAGRPIKLVQANTDPTSSTPAEQQDQAACAKYTEDNKVLAVVSIVTTTPTFDDCMAKRGVIYIANSITQPDTVYNDSVGFRFAVSPAADRMGVTLASELLRTGYLKDQGIKLGIASEDHPWYRRAAAAFKDAVKRIGGPAVSEEFYGCSGCSGDQATQQAQNAALRFRAAGITHVALPDGSAGGGSFLGQANAAGYFPRLGLTSSNLPSLIVLNVPNPQGLVGAVAIGFMPTLDTDGSPDHGAPPLTEREKLCDEIMSGYPGTERNNRLAEEQAQFTCDGFFMLKEVGDRAGEIERTSFTQAVESLGDAYVPTLTPTAWFGPGRHDGVQMYRPLKFDQGCTCFVYYGDLLPFTPLPGRQK